MIPLVVLCLTLLGSLAQAQTFSCADTACLLAAMRESRLGTRMDITLAPGIYALTAPQALVQGATGLPTVRGHLTITGAGMLETGILRAANAPNFRIAFVEATGTLILKSLTLHGGRLNSGGVGVLNFGTLELQDVLLQGHTGFSTGPLVFGVGLANFGGTVTLQRSIIGLNVAEGDGVSTAGVFSEGGTVTLSLSQVLFNTNTFAGAALYNNGGTLTILGSGITDNIGGIATVINTGTLAIQKSTCARNTSRLAGCLLSDQPVAISRSTIAHNEARPTQPGDAAVGGLLLTSVSDTVSLISDSTIAENTVRPLDTAGLEVGGLVQQGGPVHLRNVTVARNAGRTSAGLWGTAGLILESSVLSGPPGPLCDGPLTSLGYNAVESVDCARAVQATDLVGGVALGAYEEGTFGGSGVVPLLAGSAGIDAGHAATCAARDQVGQKRVGICDSGAVEVMP